MVYQNYIESDLKFSFDHNWVVKKYDEHAYFKALAGFGLKGVDFIGIYRMEQLYLIEIKNYNHRDYSPVSPDWSDLMGDEPPLAIAFKEKVDDSFKLIRIVKAYLNRKWWYNIMHSIHKFLGAKRLEKDWKFWTKVIEISNESNCVNAVLWLELDPNFLKQESIVESDYMLSFEKLINKVERPNIKAMKVDSIRCDSESIPGLKVEKVASK